MLDSKLKKGSYLNEVLDRSKLDEILSKGGTWFGQLMSAPQLMAWLIQFDFWLEKYKINLI